MINDIFDSSTKANAGNVAESVDSRTKCSTLLQNGNPL